MDKAYTSELEKLAKECPQKTGDKFTEKLCNISNKFGIPPKKVRQDLDTISLF